MLIVGEGQHEEAFLTHVKSLFIQRGCGLSVAITNARGKGAAHVIDWTIRQMTNRAYDKVAVLLDTDTNWNAAVETRARRKKIVVLTSDPCFEAMLLRGLGHNATGNAKVLKKAFAPLVKGDPTLSTNYRDAFDDSSLQQIRRREATIDELLKLLGS